MLGRYVTIRGDYAMLVACEVLKTVTLHSKLKVEGRQIFTLACFLEVMMELIRVHTTLEY